MRCAFGKIKLTPPDHIKGRALCGYIPSPTCDGTKYDDIHAYAVLFEDTMLGNIPKYMIWISMDFLKLPLLFTDYVKEKIQERFQIHPYQILIHATHTHKSFDMGGEFAFKGNYVQFVRSIMFGSYYSDDRYKVWIAKQLLHLVGTLLKELQPCKIAWTKQSIKEELSINRMYPERVIESKLGVISIKLLKDNQILGVIANFAAHPTTLNSNIKKMSADYPGRFVSRIDSLTDHKTAGIFFNGPSGDINPITTCGTDHAALAKNAVPIYGQKGTFKHTKQVGYAIADGVLDIVKKIPDSEYMEELKFESYTRMFWVPLKNFSKKVNPITFVMNKIIFAVKKYILFKVAITLGEAIEPNFPGFAVKHRGKEINCYSYVQYIHLKGTSKNGSKELSIAGIPGELFEDYGKEIYKKTPTGPDNTFIFQVANDWIGYLMPLKTYISKSGWEVFSSFSPLAGAYVRNNYFYLLRDIMEQTTAGLY